MHLLTEGTIEESVTPNLPHREGKQRLHSPFTDIAAFLGYPARSCFFCVSLRSGEFLPYHKAPILGGVMT